MNIKRNFYWGTVIGVIILQLIFALIAFITKEWRILLVGIVLTILLYGGGIGWTYSSTKNLDASVNSYTLRENRGSNAFVCGIFGYFGAWVLDPPNWFQL